MDSATMIEAADSLFVVRHGSSGGRTRSDQGDRFRRLDERGRSEAEELARVFVALQPPAILTSSFARCIETVEPLARALGLELEGCTELMIGADPRQTRKLLLGARPGAVVCTHREVIDALLGRVVGCEKAGVLVLQRNAGDLSVLDYMPSPVRDAASSLRAADARVDQVAPPRRAPMPTARNESWRPPRSSSLGLARRQREGPSL